MVVAADVGKTPSGDGEGLPGVLVAGIFVAHRPALAGKGLRLFAPCGRTALCFSIRTARQIGSLPEHDGQVGAVCAGPMRSDKVEAIATGSSAGELKIWDSKALLCLGQVRLAGPILDLRWPEPGVLLALLGERGGSARIERLRVDDLAAPVREGAPPLSAEAAGPFEARDDLLALADGGVMKVRGKDWPEVRKLSHRKRLTAAMVDEQKQFLVAGDEDGVVWTWWGVLDIAQSSKMIPAKWHWHHTPVRTLAQCGPIVLSGADEGVLCLRGAYDNEHSVRFIPNFPGPLRHIVTSADGQRTCASVGGNAIAIINELQGWVQPRYIYGIDVPVMSTSVDTGDARSTVLHPLTHGGVALTSSGRRVQFLDGEGRLEPSRMLTVNRGSKEHDVVESKWKLWHVAFSASGAHVMTLESRRSPALEHFHTEKAHSTVLKWWVRSGEGGAAEYSLHSVSHSNRPEEVTVALAHPMRERFFITAGLDGTFRFWDLMVLNEHAAAEGGGAEGEGAAAKGVQRQCWQCVLAGSWHGWPVLSGCLSPDGSTLALGHRGFVTLWESESGAELQQLALRDEAHEVGHLQSLVACGCFLLLASTHGKGFEEEEICCWDLAVSSVVARLDLAAQLEGNGPSLIRASAPSSCASGFHLLASRSPQLQLWWASSKADPSKEWSMECVARLPLDRSILDAVFVGAGRRLLCWNASSELWDLDLSEDGPALRVAEERRTRKKLGGLQGDAEEGEGDGTKKASHLTHFIGAKATVQAVGEQPWRLVATAARSTAVQQAGLTQQLAARVVPPHVPSHMLHPPSMLWESFLTTFGKAPPFGLSGSPLEPRQGGAQASTGESTGGPRQEAAHLEGDVPPWIIDGQPAEAQPEVVDAAWMDSFLKDALQATE